MPSQRLRHRQQNPAGNSAKYVYGVTATPFRGDGLERINEMLLGPVRFEYTAKKKLKSKALTI
jgi:superfamily II DNA or RNA helicase